MRNLDTPSNERRVPHGESRLLGDLTDRNSGKSRQDFRPEPLPLLILIQSLISL